jgi:hypothetical protein
MTPSCTPELSFSDPSRPPAHVVCDAPDLVSDTGLLTLRDLDLRLGYLDDLARRLPDPRSQPFVLHTRQALLAQQVYQILADCSDCNDAQTLRADPLFQTLAGLTVDPHRPLASGSTLARFQYAFTRRQCQLPEEDRPAFREMYRAQSQRVGVVNQFLVETFIRTRRAPPAAVILDLDPTDDPVHGRQALGGYHGYYRQHQYYPLLVFEGQSGFPLAAWLRPGTAHAATGAVEILRDIVTALRRAWPFVVILVRGDCGLAVPALYEFCEREGLLYAFGYPSNAALVARTAAALNELEIAHFFIGQYEPHLQRFAAIEDYQAEGWGQPRRLVCKLECTPQGSQRRFVVTNLAWDPRGLYLGFYVQRGAVPEQPLGELKNGLDLGRLSAHGFRANAYRLLLQVVAYGLVVLFREAVAVAATAAPPATAAELVAVSRAAVSTLRTWLWEVPAVVEVRARSVWFHVARSWPWRGLWQRVQRAVETFATELRPEGLTM